MADRQDDSPEQTAPVDDFWTANAPPEAPPAPTADGGPPAEGWQAWFSSLTGGKPPTPAELVALESTLGGKGVKVLRNAKGTAGKIQLPDGAIVDVIEGADAGGRAWSWQTGEGGGGGEIAMPDFGQAPDPYQSSAWSGGEYQAPALPAWLQGPYVAPTWQGGDFVAPTKPGVLQSPFAMPTQQELEASPGYTSRLAAGNLSRERSAAAKGTILSGGTQKAAERFGQDYASGEYGNLFGQKLATRQQNVSEYDTDHANAFDTYKQRYGQFVDSANLDMGARQQNAGEFGQQANIANQTFQNNYSMYKDDEARKLNDYLSNWTVQRAGDQDYWGRLNDVANRGVAAGSY